MTLRALLAALDPAPADTLTPEQRDWLHVVAATRDIYRARQAGIEQRMASIADESQAEDPDTRRRREFWARVTPPSPAARVVLPFDRRHA